MLLLRELKRRHVWRVLGYYIAGAVATLEAASLILPRLGIPDWTITLLLGLMIVGLPLAAALAWAYDITPDGIQRSRALPSPAPALLPLEDERPSIAVLPFANLSAEAENGFFSEGVTEDILMHLGKVRALRVTSRTSVLKYRNTTKDIAEIAAELRVRYVLEGSVRVSGGRVRVVAQLIDATSDAHLWAETYDRALDDVFTVQSEVAEAVARALAKELSPSELREIRKAPTDNVEAYALYLQGVAAFNTWMPADLMLAANQFRSAIDIDSGYANAHAGLALALAIAPAFGGSSYVEFDSTVRESTKRALELDPTSSAAQMAKAFVAWRYDYDWLTAEAAVREALRLEPDNPQLLACAAYYFGQLGRFSETLELVDAALALNPGSSSVTSIRAFVEYYIAAWTDLDFSKPLRTLDDLIARDPGYAGAYVHRGICCSLAERFDECIAALDRALSFAPDVALCHGVRAYALLRTGRQTEAQAEMDWLIARGEIDGMTSYARAIALVVDDPPKAIELFVRAFHGRAFFMPFLRIVPRYAPLWKLPAIREVLEQMWRPSHRAVLGEYGYQFDRHTAEAVQPEAVTH